MAKGFVWKKTPEGKFITPAREKYLETHPTYSTSPDVQLTPANIEAIQKSGGVQAGTPLAKALEGKQVQVVAAPGTRGVAEGTPVAYQQFQKGAYYTIHPSNLPSPTTQQHQIPPTTTSAMSQAQYQNYNQQVQQAYQAQLQGMNIEYNYMLGNFGNYNQKEGKIYVSKIFPFKDRTIAHEVGHKLNLGSKETTDYSKYKAASRNLIPDFLENIGYKKGTAQYEYYARAFSNYIKNPERFKQNYPEVASEFESRLGLASTQATPIDQTKVSAISSSQILTKEPTKEIKSSIGEKIGSFLFGEVGEKFMKVPIFIGAGIKDITLKDIRTGLYKEEKLGLPGKVVSEFIPTTPGEVVIMGGTAVIFPYLPKIIKIGATGTISYASIKDVLNPETPKEQKIASGIVGGLSIIGTAIEVYPYVKGGLARLSSGYKSIKTSIVEESWLREGKKIYLEHRAGKFDIADNLIPFVSPTTPFKKPGTFVSFETIPSGILAIRDVGEAGIIGIIRKGSPLKEGLTRDIDLPKISPLVRGGFEVKPLEKELFLGEQIVTTSQRGLFKEGKDIPILREFFVTPEEPFLNIPETRESRLGITGLFESIKKFEIKFGLPETPQIGLIKTNVGRIETPDQFIIGTGSELEAIKTFGTITDIEKIGVTTYKGYGVDIFGFKIGQPGVDNVRGTFPKIHSSSDTTTRVSGESLFATIGGTLRTIDKTTKNLFGRTSTQLTSNIQPISTSINWIDFSPTPPIPTPTPTISYGGGGGGDSIIITPPIPPPVPIPPTSPPTIPPTLPPTLLYPPIMYGSYEERKKRRLKQVPTFSVQIRRRGKYRPAFANVTLAEAKRLGSEKILGNLGRTFRIKPTGKTREIFGIEEEQMIPQLKKFREFKIRKGKQIATPLQFTQLTEFNLKSLGEKQEIKLAKQIKGYTLD